VKLPGFRPRRISLPRAADLRPDRVGPDFARATDREMDQRRRNHERDLQAASAIDHEQ
jgi:hypothetical protein